MYNANDVVYCRSGDGNHWLGYIKEVFPEDEVIIRWWSWRAKRWHETTRFVPDTETDRTFAVIGQLPWDVEFDDIA